jgi:hypothetical protein
MKRFLYVVAFIVLFMSGCSALNNLWPIEKSKMARDYIGVDPNGFPITTIAKEKQIRSEVIHKHIITQLGLKHAIAIDKADHDAAMEVDGNIKVAEAERDSIVGTVERPGWLLTMLLGASGLGLYTVGAKQQRPEDYNETEMENEVMKRVAVELAKLNKVQS